MCDWSLLSKHELYLYFYLFCQNFSISALSFLFETVYLREGEHTDTGRLINSNFFFKFPHICQSFFFCKKFKTWFKYLFSKHNVSIKRKRMSNHIKYYSNAVKIINKTSFIFKLVHSSPPPAFISSHCFMVITVRRWVAHFFGAAISAALWYRVEYKVKECFFITCLLDKCEEIISLSAGGNPANMFTTFKTVVNTTWHVCFFWRLPH